MRDVDGSDSFILAIDIERGSQTIDSIDIYGWFVRSRQSFHRAVTTTVSAIVGWDTTNCSRKGFFQFIKFG